MNRMRPVIQSQKMQVFVASASVAAATVVNNQISVGTDAVAAGQTGVTDSAVPTGAIIKYIEIHYVSGNLVLINNFVNWIIQRAHSGQSPISPLAVGGSPQRNQVFKSGMFALGQQQNSTHVIRFMVPKPYQRVREGDKWFFTTVGVAIHTDQVNIHYKYYR